MFMLMVVSAHIVFLQVHLWTFEEEASYPGYSPTTVSESCRSNCCLEAGVYLISVQYILWHLIRLTSGLILCIIILALLLSCAFNSTAFSAQ